MQKNWLKLNYILPERIFSRRLHMEINKVNFLWQVLYKMSIKTLVENYSMD